MTDSTGTPRSIAQAYTATARDAFRRSATLFHSLSDDEWQGPTGCVKWDMHALAGHIVGESVFFAHLVRQAAEAAPPLPNELWGQLSALPGEEIAQRIESSADELVDNVNNTSDVGLEKTADLGFASFPLYKALYMSLFEGVIHDWDARARREQNASIPSDWAAQVAAGLPWLLPELAHRHALSEAAGRYLLLVGNDVGPVTITVSPDGATVQAGKPEDSPVTLSLSADAYVRLITGRYPLRPAIDGGEVQVEGDDRRAQSLNAVFAGVAND